MNPTTSQDALTAVQKAQQSAQDPNTYLASQNQTLGVNDAQNTVTGLRGAINNTTKLLQQVAPSIMGRTATSLVNAGAAQKQIANEQAPISATLTEQGNQYNEANQNLSQLQTRAQQAAAGQYQGQQDRLSYLQNIYNQLYQREQDAATQAEQKRQFDLELAATRASSAANGYNLESILNGTQGTGTSQTPTVTPEEESVFNRAKSLQNIYESGDVGLFNKGIQTQLARARAGDKTAKQIILNAYKLVGKQDAQALKAWGLV